MKFRHYHIRSHAVSGGLSPVQVAQAYQYKKLTSQVSTVKIGIGSLGGSVALGDVQTAFATYGLPIPKITVMTVDGAAVVADPGGADVENMLDILCTSVAWSYCTGTPADITICIGPNSATGIADVTTALVNAGCEVISWSWGGPESSWDASSRAITEQAFQSSASRGVIITAASGDNSADDGTGSQTVDYPAGSQYIWAVGGTKLILNSDGSVAQESAWGDGSAQDQGTGGGYDRNTPQPSWQSVAVGSKSAFRGAPDSSANADPSTGYQIYVNGQWGIVGGTSGASPITAGYLAVCKAVASANGISNLGMLGPVLYPHAECFNDITVGSNGLPATVGWDACTGLGTPNGPNLFNILVGLPTTQPSPPTSNPPSSPPVNNPPPVTQPPVQQPPPVSTSLSFDQVMELLEAAYANRPYILLLLKEVQLWGDALLAQNGLNSNISWSVLPTRPFPVVVTGTLPVATTPAVHSVTLQVPIGSMMVDGRVI